MVFYVNKIVNKLDKKKWLPTICIVYINMSACYIIKNFVCTYIDKLNCNSIIEIV